MQQCCFIHYEPYDVLMHLEYQMHVQQMHSINKMHLKHHQAIQSITIFF